MRQGNHRRKKITQPYNRPLPGPCIDQPNDGRRGKTPVPDKPAVPKIEQGIPKTVAARMETIRSVMGATRKAGLPDDKIYVDPLLLTIATDTESTNVSLETMRAVRAEFPAAHLIVGLSNASFGLPVRSLINRTLLVLAMSAGLDTAIADPLDSEIRATALAADLLLGRDRHCMTYVRAHRTGLLEAAAPKAV